MSQQNVQYCCIYRACQENTDACRLSFNKADQCYSAADALGAPTTARCAEAMALDYGLWFFVTEEDPKTLRAIDAECWKASAEVCPERS
jgi:hypothetical protein